MTNPTDETRRQATVQSPWDPLWETRRSGLRRNPESRCDKYREHGRILASEQITQAIDLWLKTAQEFGDPIPEPKGERLMLAWKEALPL